MTLNINLRIVKALNVLIYPFLPFAAIKLWNTLGHDSELTTQPWAIGLEEIKEGQELIRPEPLFKKLELEEVIGPVKEEPIEELKKEEIEMITIEDFGKMELRIGEVKLVEDHPNAEKLYIMKVDFGEEGGGERQIVAGLKGYYEKDEILGKKIVVITNLAPAKLRGVDSNGMLLAAEDGKGNIALLVPDKEIEKGSRVR